MTPPRIHRHAPYFPVADVAASTAYYVKSFGFRAEYSAGNPPEFAIVSRDGSAVMLRRVADASRIRPMESQGGTWDAFFWVEGIDALAAEFAAAGVVFVYQPTLQPYGTKEFAVADPDGHVLGFGEQQ